MTLRFGGATILAGLLLLLFCLLFYFFWVLWQRRGRLADIVLRRLRPAEVLRSLLHRAAEMGDGIHLSPGRGAIHDPSTIAETMAGLDVLQATAKEALAVGVPVRATSSDSLVAALVENRLEQAWKAAGRPEVEVRGELLAQQDRVAYAAGVTDLLGRPEIQGNVMLGTLGEEVLLMGEVGAHQTRFQVAGAARPVAATFLPLFTDDYLLGEELYAAGAYLEPRPERVVSLMAQDGIRMLLLSLILLGTILATAGVLEGILGPLFQGTVP